MANYQKEMTREPIEANSQHYPHIIWQASSPHERVFLRAEFAHSTIT